MLLTKFSRGQWSLEIILDQRYCQFCIKFLCISTFLKLLKYFICIFISVQQQVTVILEIIIRKCGFAAVQLVTPEKYRRFLKTVLEVINFLMF